MRGQAPGGCDIVGRQALATWASVCVQLGDIFILIKLDDKLFKISARVRLVGTSVDLVGDICLLEMDQLVQ